MAGCQKTGSSGKTLFWEDTTRPLENINVSCHIEIKSFLLDAWTIMSSASTD
jgi:hypothetical protein